MYIMCTFQCPSVLVLCAGISRTLLTVSFFLLICGYLRFVSYQITLFILCVIARAVRLYDYVFMLVCTQVPSFSYLFF